MVRACVRRESAGAQERTRSARGSPRASEERQALVGATERVRPGEERRPGIADAAGLCLVASECAEACRVWHLRQAPAWGVESVQSDG